MRRVRAVILALVTLVTAAWLGVTALGNDDAAPEPTDGPSVVEVTP